MNTSQIKNFAIQSRNILKAGVLNRILTLGFDERGNLIVDRPVKIQGGTVFMDQLREETFYDAWTALESRLAKHGIKEVCEEAAYTWFNRLVAIRIMQKNEFIEPVMQYVSQETRIPIIVDQARSGRLSLKMSAQDEAKLNDLLRDSTKTNEQFNLLISAYCLANPVIFNCFGGIEKHISLLLPDNILSQGGFIDLLNNTPYLTDEDYTKSELIGWLYQFYISEKKDEVFAKKGKYAPDEIPAATQIFTPNWIVKYMVENTIGRIYLDNNPDADQIKDSMKYLVEPSEPTPKDAILKLDELTEYKMIDNACGSGHILIEGFNLFYRMYKYEGYASRVAIENILKKNIIGLDLDTRAKQLATFALLMTAAKIDKSFLDCKVMPRVLDFPEPFVYRWGTMEDFLPHYFLGGNQKIYKETIEAFELLKDADSLGSIMKFEISAETREAIRRSTEDWEKQEFLNENIAAAIPSMKIILALSDKYSAAVMNPPYMKSARFDSTLSSYADRNYEDSKTDLFSIFMCVGLDALVEKGKLGMINMQSWLFLSSFEDLRTRLLSNYNIESLLHLGARTFDELSGEVVQNVSFVISQNKPLNQGGIYYRLTAYSCCKDKEDAFLSHSDIYKSVSQNGFSSIPGSQLAYWLSPSIIRSFSKEKLSSFAKPSKGMMPGSDYIRLFWEVAFYNIDRTVKTHEQSALSPKKWYPYFKGGSFRRWYGNREYVVDYQHDGERVKDGDRNPGIYFKDNINWSKISSGLFSARAGAVGGLYDDAACQCYVFDRSLYWYLLGLLNTKYSQIILWALNQTYNYISSDVSTIPAVVCQNKVPHIDQLVKSSVLLSKSDWDTRETSIDFKGNELLCILDSNLVPYMRINSELQPVQAQIADLVDQYKLIWRNNFNKLHENEEDLNRQFIEIYGLQDELSPDVPLNEITILQNGEISIENNEIVWHDDVLIKQLISYAVGCWMGRYRLDKEGLNIAHYPSEEEICTYEYNGTQFEIDDDAIIPIMGGNNPFEDDNALQKIINFVKIVFGEENLTKNLNYIEHCLGKSLESYLVKDFWKDHKKMYQNRPIYWLFASKKGAFQVLTYMHRMNPYTVEKIRTKYLLPYIDFLKGRIEVDEARGSELSSVERSNLAKMRVALDECNEYHDRLHEVAIQAIDFDLDDGVVVNYAKFGDVVAKIK